MVAPVILDTTSKVLQIVLGEAQTTNPCPVVTSWAGMSLATWYGGNTNINSNGTAPVTVVAAPVAGLSIDVREVRLFNADTVSHTVTLQLYDGTNTWPIAPAKVSVPANGSFVYTPEAGVTVTSGDSQISYASLSLTSAQLLALNSSPISVIPGQTGQIIAVQWSCITLDYNSTTYVDSGTNTGLYYQNSSGPAIDNTLYNCLQAAASEVKYSSPALLHAQTGVIGQPVVLTGSSNLTTGNSPAKLTVAYTVITP